MRVRCVGVLAPASSVETDELATQLANNWESLFLPTRLDDQAMEVNGTTSSLVADKAMEVIALQSAAGQGEHRQHQEPRQFVVREAPMPPDQLPPRRQRR